MSQATKQRSVLEKNMEKMVDTNTLSKATLIQHHSTNLSILVDLERSYSQRIAGFEASLRMVEETIERYQKEIRTFSLEIHCYEETFNSFPWQEEDIAIQLEIKHKLGELEEKETRSRTNKEVYQREKKETEIRLAFYQRLLSFVKNNK